MGCQNPSNRTGRRAIPGDAPAGAKVFFRKLDRLDLAINPIEGGRRDPFRKCINQVGNCGRKVRRSRNAPLEPIVMNVFHKDPFFCKTLASARLGFSQNRETYWREFDGDSVRIGRAESIRNFRISGGRSDQQEPVFTNPRELQCPIDSRAKNRGLPDTRPQIDADPQAVRAVPVDRGVRRPCWPNWRNGTSCNGRGSDRSRARKQAIFGYVSEFLKRCT